MIAGFGVYADKKKESSQKARRKCVNAISAKLTRKI